MMRVRRYDLVLVRNFANCFKRLKYQALQVKGLHQHVPLRMTLSWREYQGVILVHCTYTEEHFEHTSVGGKKHHSPVDVTFLTVSCHVVGGLWRIQTSTTTQCHDSIVCTNGKENVIYMI